MSPLVVKIAGAVKDPAVNLGETKEKGRSGWKTWVKREVTHR